MPTDSGYISLLWPGARHTVDLSDETWRDLGLDQIVDALTLEPSRRAAIEAIVRRMPADHETIAYRSDITGALLEHEGLADAFCALVPVVERLRYYAFRPDRYDWTPLQEVVWRIRELEHYVELLDRMGDAFDSLPAGTRSDGLNRLAARVKHRRSAPVYARLHEELPGLLETVDSFRSVSIGINLGGGLEPIEATILSVGATPYRGSGLAGRILGDRPHAGLGPLHTAMTPESAGNPLLVPLFKDLSGILQKAARPLAAGLTEFSGLMTRNMVAIADELLFYAGVVRLARSLSDAGLPVCIPVFGEHGGRPEGFRVAGPGVTERGLAEPVGPKSRAGLGAAAGPGVTERSLAGPGGSKTRAGLGVAAGPGVTERGLAEPVGPKSRAGLGAAVQVSGLYNLHLAIRRLASRSKGCRPAADIVASTVEPAGGERIALITGPNSGGKTTFLQGVGVAQIAGQLGLFAPARSMTFSPVDALLTHYPALEKIEDEAGRFAEEAGRLKSLLNGVTANTLLLLNETLSSTAMGEAVFIARDVLAHLRAVGARVLFVTHIHELAASAPAGVLSLVAQTRTAGTEVTPTFEVVPGNPAGASYAATLARRHGLDPVSLSLLEDAPTR